MANGVFTVPDPKNEPVLTYAPGTPEKQALKTRLAELSRQLLDIPIVIGGKEVRTGRVAEIRVPHDHGPLLGHFHQAGAPEVQAAIDAAQAARRDWAAMPWAERAAIFLKAAELLAGPWRQVSNAATMLGQIKTPFQAEIDSACEIIDFWRFNTRFMEQIYGEQPQSTSARWNRLEYRPLDGFVFAVTPFNFTSIAANLPTAPAMMGNTVVWKPASTAVYAAWHILKRLEAAGLPPGVINMVPGPGRAVGDPALGSPDFAGLHFPGSTAVFQGMWKTIGTNISRYRAYPRIVGETGGKDFVFAHPSADLDGLATALVRGAYEYQGQKCSAASRAYVPESLWPRLKPMLVETIRSLKMGDVTDFTCFMGAVIDRAAFDNIKGYIDLAKSSPDYELLCGGGCDDSRGYFIEPTLVLSKSPRSKLLEEEIFGPVLTVYVYPDDRLEETVDLCDRGSPYALTGAVFARDRAAITHLSARLAGAAGNFYVNDKPTGAVVGQQPFGGSRASGTNDKAGSLANLMRWTSPRTIAETFVSPVGHEYPHMQEG